MWSSMVDYCGSWDVITMSQLDVYHTAVRPRGTGPNRLTSLDNVSNSALLVSPESNSAGATDPASMS